MPRGVPMAWMDDLYEHAPIWVIEGKRAYFTDVDGHRYLIRCVPAEPARVGDVQAGLIQNGSSSPTSASLGPFLSRSESCGSDTGHSTPTSGSSHAIPASVAGS